MTGKYTIKELHEMSGIKIATLRQRAILFKFPSTWIYTGKEKKVKTKLIELDEKSYELITNPNKLGRIIEKETHPRLNISEGEKEEIKKDMQGKCKPKLRIKQEQWMIGLGLFPVPKTAEKGEKNVYKSM